MGKGRKHAVWHVTGVQVEGYTKCQKVRMTLISSMAKHEFEPLMYYEKETCIFSNREK